ncbi:MAG: hypothetical protein L3J43_03925 [Sulfurovum sp.]|nr:hypothetical protein [Sulfurovum sp.]
MSNLTEELRDLKAQLDKSITTAHKHDKYLSEAYFEFVTKLREKMRANVEKNYYPKIRIDGLELGIDFKGLLYDRKTNRNLPRALAFDVYHRLYDQHLIKPHFK